MKLKGKKLQGLHEVVIPIPRADCTHIFIARAVPSLLPLDKLLKPPKAPVVVTPTGKKENFNSPEYKFAVVKHDLQREAWVILQSLKATPELEWERCNDNDPESWLLWAEELKDADFTWKEIQRIKDGVFDANCLNENLIEEARQSFLRGTLDQSSDTSGPSTGPENSQSGEPASE